MISLFPDLPRRDQILTATLDLLATTPLERLTTRHIAERVGVTQPALFRHFRSREALLLGVVREARAALSARLTPLLLEPEAPLDRCESLARLLAEFIDHHPGLPRLLFADLAFEAPELRLAVQQLVAMQHTLVAALVADAQRDGSARQVMPHDAAATLFVSMVQGLALQGLLRPDAKTPPMVERLVPVLALWRVAVQTEEQAAALPTTATRVDVCALDARPILAAGRDPLADVLATLTTLAPGSALVVTAPFRPRPLEALLTSRGHGVSAHAGSDGLWSLLVLVDDATRCLDLRDLEAPEPMEHLLAIAARMEPGQAVLAHVPRHPRWLLPQLQARGLRFGVAELADGTAVVRVAAQP